MSTPGPSPGPDRFRQLRALFEAAAAAPTDDREPMVRRATADPELVAEVLALLRAASTTGSESDAAARLRTTGTAPMPRPRQIGPYTILDVLGEGGMGTDYLAEQSKPVERRVALQLIKLGMDSKAVVARFELERQALALMDHDGIAKVYDCGTSERGQPYFVNGTRAGCR